MFRMVGLLGLVVVGGIAAAYFTLYATGVKVANCWLCVGLTHVDKTVGESTECVSDKEYRLMVKFTEIVAKPRHPDDSGFAKVSSTQNGNCVTVSSALGAICRELRGGWSGQSSVCDGLEKR